MEVADNILLFHAPQELCKQYPGKHGDELPQANARLLTDVVYGPNGDIQHPKIIYVEHDQQMVRVSITLVELIKGERLQRLERNGSVARL